MRAMLTKDEIIQACVEALQAKGFAVNMKGKCTFLATVADDSIQDISFSVDVRPGEKPDPVIPQR